MLRYLQRGNHPDKHKTMDIQGYHPWCREGKESQESGVCADASSLGCEAKSAAETPASAAWGSFAHLQVRSDNPWADMFQKRPIAQSPSSTDVCTVAGLVYVAYPIRLFLLVDESSSAELLLHGRICLLPSYPGSLPKTATTILHGEIFRIVARVRIE